MIARKKLESTKAEWDALINQIMQPKTDDETRPQSIHVTLKSRDGTDSIPMFSFEYKADFEIVGNIHG